MTPPDTGHGDRTVGNRAARAVAPLPAVAAATLAAGIIVLGACQTDWPAFRSNNLRTGRQPSASALGDPAQVPSLSVAWQFPAAGATPVGAFRASPVVFNERVFVGSGDGHMYALDANTGVELWHYPATGGGLLSSFTCNPSSLGVASSAVMANIDGKDAVVFGAPDPALGGTPSSGRLFALDAATGLEIWKSPAIAHLGVPASNLHEQIGYSAPLVFNDRVYVGIADHCDNPIQKGRVAAVMLATMLPSMVVSTPTMPKSASPGTPPPGVCNWMPSSRICASRTKKRLSR